MTGQAVQQHNKCGDNTKEEISTLNWKDIRTKLLNRGFSAKMLDERILPLMKEIDTIRKEKGAIILAHYYQTPPIQLLADKVGDSFALAKTAKSLEGDRLVVSSTVEFMAEMVKLLSPDKKVVIPGTGASCSIAEGMDPATIERIRDAFPNAAVVGYINSFARTMAAYDSTCTSTNALQVVQNIKGDPVIMVPDYYLAVNTFKKIEDDRTYLAYEKILNGHIILHDVKKDKRFAIPLGHKGPQRDQGTCIVHERFTPEEIDDYRIKEQVDLVLGHPEVKPEVAAKADFVGSTGNMISHVKSSDAKRILVLSECNLVSPLLDTYPEKTFVTPCKLCPYMGRNTLENLKDALLNETNEIQVSSKVAKGASAALEKMFELSV